MRNALALPALVIITAVVACTTTTKPADGPYPAFEFDAPQLAVNHSVIITAPKIVTVTWSADPNAAALESFGDQLGASDYWKSTVGEYGVGAATSQHVHITTPPPATMTPEDVDTWFVAELGGKSDWPTYDPSTIYVIYIPAATKLDPSDPYHSETAVGANAHVPYVVLPSGGDLGKVTEAASHEIAETVTNPRVLSTGADLGLVDFDHSKYLAWSLSTGDAELGDLCEGKPDSAVTGPAGFPYRLQRLWSNKSALAGHDPCAPAPAAPYYNVTPIDLEPISVFVDTDTTPSRGPGYRIRLGQKRTIRVGFFSDAKMAAPWTITAAEGSYFSPASNHRLTINVTAGTGNNGDYGSIEVTANAESAGAGNAVLLTVTSQAPGLPAHTSPIVIGTY